MADNESSEITVTAVVVEPPAEGPDATPPESDPLLNYAPYTSDLMVKGVEPTGEAATSNGSSD